MLGQNLAHWQKSTDKNFPFEQNMLDALKTKNLKEECQKADILIAAVGVANLVKEDWVKKDSIIIDVGINKIEGKIVGDVKFDEVNNKVKAITPVPGGVGPMTIACLLKNTLECFKGR